MAATLWTIEQRLFHSFNIRIRNHIGTLIQENDSLLDGITFEAVDHAKLSDAIRAAKDRRGRTAFAGGRVDGKDHLPLQASFGATKGEGFREIYHLEDSRPNALSMGEDAGFSAMFAEVPNEARMSLHFAISPLRCNVHLDQRGFVLAMPGGGVALTPDFADHIANELLWKSKAKEWIKFLPP